MKRCLNNAQNGRLWKQVAEGRRSWYNAWRAPSVLRIFPISLCRWLFLKLHVYVLYILVRVPNLNFSDLKEREKAYSQDVRHSDSCVTNTAVVSRERTLVTRNLVSSAFTSLCENVHICTCVKFYHDSIACVHASWRIFHLCTEKLFLWSQRIYSIVWYNHNVVILIINF